MAGSKLNTKYFKNRQPRVNSSPADRNYVRYIPYGTKESSMAAQFSDVSATGMRLISRQAAKTNVGDQLDVQFTLPGSRREVLGRARVVRRINDFEFAVSFVGFQDNEQRSVQNALQEYLTYLRMTPIAKQSRKFAEWLAEHRRGLAIALTGLAIFSMTCTWIYLNSDEHVGRHLKSWAKPYPRQWDFDYSSKK